MTPPRTWTAVSVVIALIVGAPMESRAQDIAALRAVIEKSGGSLRLDAQGEPSEIDWTAGRGSADAAALEAILKWPSVQILRVRVGPIPPEELVKIGSLTRLRELTLQDALLDDGELLTIVERLRELRKLTLRNGLKVSDHCVEALVRRSALTHLALIDMQVTDGALPAIAAAPALVSLDLRQCSRITSKGLLILGKAAALRELKIGGQGIDNEAVTAVATIPRLESLTVEDAPVGAAGLTRLMDQPDLALRLRQVALARCQALPDAALEPLGRLPNLVQLSVRDMPVTGTFLHVLQAPEKLQVLSLSETYLNAEAFGTLAQCRQLKRLELAQVPVSPEAMQAISTLSNLEYLNLAECGINDESLAMLAKLKKLKTLVIDGNPDVTPEALANCLNSLRSK